MSIDYVKLQIISMYVFLVLQQGPWKYESFGKSKLIIIMIW